MEELYSIMRDFLEVEHHLESFACLLSAAETTYSDENQKEAKTIAACTKFYLKALQEELKMAINRLDSYIVEGTQNR